MHLHHSQGVVVIVVAFFMMVFLGFAALLVDVNVIYNAKEKLQQATDNAALAGAGVIAQGEQQVQSTTLDFLKLNPIQPNVVASEPIIEIGSWDETTDVFSDNNRAPTAVRVTASYSVNAFIGVVFGFHHYTFTTTSVASIVDNRPLNIMFVVDVSSNMKALTPEPAKTPEEPLQAVKNGVIILLGMLRSGIDNAGLAVITNPPLIKQAFSSDFTLVSKTLGELQAGQSSLSNGTIADTLEATFSAFPQQNQTNGKNVLIVFSNGQTPWNNGHNFLNTLISQQLIVDDVVIGTDQDSSTSTRITSDTLGARFPIDINAVDYTPQMQALYAELKTGPARLVQ